MEFIFFYAIATIIIMSLILSVMLINNLKNKKEIKGKKPAISNRILIYPLVFFAIVATYRNLNSNETTNYKPTQEIQYQTRAPIPEEEKKYLQENNLLKIGNENHWCGIKENGEVKFINDILNRNCKNDLCKIQNYFNYVKRIEYKEGEKNNNKNAVDVIMNDKGDCDEKSHLLASLMLQGNYETILIYTKDHAFAGLNIPNYKSKERKSYFKYKGKKFYYAETTDRRAEIGAYNGIDPKEFKFAYNVKEKKEIPLNEIEAKIYL